MNKNLIRKTLTAAVAVITLSMATMALPADASAWSRHGHFMHHGHFWFHGYGVRHVGAWPVLGCWRRTPVGPVNVCLQ
jgi:hypothetical protein